jgi:hypothetical protein
MKFLKELFPLIIILKNDKTIIPYHFGQYYCLLQKEWRLPKIEIDWLIKVLRNGCFHNGQVICPRLVIMAQGRLYWPEAISKFQIIPEIDKISMIVECNNKQLLPSMDVNIQNC